MNIRRRMVGKSIPERNTEKLTAAARKPDIAIKAFSICWHSLRKTKTLLLCLETDSKKYHFWYRTLDCTVAAR